MDERERLQKDIKDLFAAKNLVELAYSCPGPESGKITWFIMEAITKMRARLAALEKEALR